MDGGRPCEEKVENSKEAPISREQRAIKCGGKTKEGEETGLMRRLSSRRLTRTQVVNKLLNKPCCRELHPHR